MNELIKINYEQETPMVSGRELHEALEVKSKYADWFKNMSQYGFEELTDYQSFSKNLENGGRTIDHMLTIPMAKEICMLQRSDKGKQFRQYFISIESAWNTPEMVMSRAIKMAEMQIKQLSVTVSRLTVDNQIMQPKAEYFDAVIDRGANMGIRETAKLFDVKESAFVQFLLDKKYLYRNNGGNLKPYAIYTGKYFESKEFVNEKSGKSGSQTLITPKGRAHFIDLVQGLERSTDKKSKKKSA